MGECARGLTGLAGGDEITCAGTPDACARGVG